MKKPRHENIRIEVTVGKHPWMTSSKEQDERFQLEHAQAIAKKIEQRLDEKVTAAVQYDIVQRCEFCGDHSEWPEGEEPSCCQKSLDEFNAKKENKA